MYSLNIKIEGKTLKDLNMGLEEVKCRVYEGYIVGSDKNYTFSIKTDDKPIYDTSPNDAK